MHLVVIILVILYDFISTVTVVYYLNYWYFSGGKTKEGYSIITFPDTGNFVDLPEEGYEKLISYTTSVPS